MDNDDLLNLVKSRQQKLGVQVFEDTKKPAEDKPKTKLDYSVCWSCRGKVNLTSILEGIPVCEDCLDDINKRLEDKCNTNT